MLRVRVCAAHMGGFLGPKFSCFPFSLGPKFLGPFFGRVSFNMGGFSRNWQKNVKNVKIHHKSGHDGNCR